MIGFIDYVKMDYETCTIQFNKIINISISQKYGLCLLYESNM